MMNSLKKNHPYPDKDMPARGGNSQGQSRPETSVHKSDSKGQTKDRANHDNARRENHGRGEAGTSGGKEEVPIPVGLPEQRPEIFTEKETNQGFPGGVTGIHVSFKISLSISALCATIIVFLAPPGAQILFFSLYSLSMLSVLVISGGKPVGPIGIRQPVFRYLLFVSREMAGLRLCLAVMSAAFFSVPDNETMIVTSGLCAVACCAVCLFQDSLAFGTRRRRVIA